MVTAGFMQWLEQAEGSRPGQGIPWRGDQGLAAGIMAGPAGLAQVSAVAFPRLRAARFLLCLLCLASPFNVTWTTNVNTLR